jgi:aspartate kinase
MLIVQKYGGSSVAGSEKVLNVARRVKSAADEGHSVVVVLSAQGDTTDGLIAMARLVNEHPSKREMDMLLSTGEQQSVALMAMALHSIGCPAVSLNAPQAGIVSSSAYSNARIKRVETERIAAELEKKQVVVVTGFQGTNRCGDVTTLGRGGSDTTAVALAAALNADLCEIYTDVDGVYTADPRVVENARKLGEISYDEMLELASLGAKVLQKRSVELAKKYGIQLVVRSSMTGAEGTIVKEEAKLEGTFVSGVAVDKNISRISLIAVNDVPGIAFKVFSLLARQNISVDIILQSIGRDNTKDITFTVAKEDLRDAIKALSDNRERIGFRELKSDDNAAKLSVVGAGMATNPGVASAFFEALYDAGVNIDMISTSEIKISVLVDADMADTGAKAAHDKFIQLNESHK